MVGLAVSELPDSFSLCLVQERQELPLEATPRNTHSLLPAETSLEAAILYVWPPESDSVEEELPVAILERVCLFLHVNTERFFYSPKASSLELNARAFTMLISPTSTLAFLIRSMRSSSDFVGTYLSCG